MDMTVTDLSVTVKTDWQALIADSITDSALLADHFAVDPEALHDVVRRYPMRINAYYLSLISGVGDPLWLQAVPDPSEVCRGTGKPDPLCEEMQSPVPGVVHRYPDRALFLVSNQCALYCRHCMRKRRVGAAAVNRPEVIKTGLEYIGATEGIEEVILSGGDPLMLPDDDLRTILESLRHMPHVRVIRIHSRMPCTLPHRITPALTTLLRQYHPLFVNTQFNHPMEITPAAMDACGRMVDAGIPVGCQSVLLKGVNDNVETLKALFRGLVRMRVRPYYLHHPDPVGGTAHFSVPLKKGLAMMAQLRGHISGICLPYYMLDLPGGGGKVPLLPDAVTDMGGGRWLIRNYQGNRFEYYEAASG